VPTIGKPTGPTVKVEEEEEETSNLHIMHSEQFTNTLVKKGSNIIKHFKNVQGVNLM
jgi:hypothetical protein